MIHMDYVMFYVPRHRVYTCGGYMCEVFSIVYLSCICMYMCGMLVMHMYDMCKHVCICV